MICRDPNCGIDHPLVSHFINCESESKTEVKLRVQLTLGICFFCGDSLLSCCMPES